MRIDIKNIIKYIIGVVICICVSYCIASVIFLDDVKKPYILNNSSFFCEEFSIKDIEGMSENLTISKPANEFSTKGMSKINIQYNHNKNSIGYVVLDFDVLSEKNMDARVCVFDENDEPTIINQKVREGLNIIHIPLYNAKKIRVDFLSTGTTYFTLNEIKFTNQLVGTLPIEWYVCFVICLILGLELVGISLFRLCKLNLLYKKFNEKIIKPIITDGEKFYKFILAYKIQFLCCLGIAIFAYGYNLTNFSLGVDEERDFVGSVGGLENVKELLLREGRVGAYLFRCVETLDGTFTPFVEEVLAILFMMLTIAVFIKCFDVVTNGNIKKSAIIIFGGMFATLPFINSEIMCYSIANAVAYFSMFLTSIALLLVALFCKYKRRDRILYAYLLTVIVLFFSEANNVWFIVGTVLLSLVGVIANSEINWKIWFKNVMIYASTYILAFITYTGLSKFVSNNGYIGSRYIRWEKGSYVETLKSILIWIQNLLTDENLPGAIYLSISVFIFIAFIFGVALKQKISRTVLNIFLTFCLCVTPFMLCFVAGGAMPYRTMRGLLLFYAGIWFVMVNFIEKKTVAKYVVIILAVVIIFKQCVWMNRIFSGADLCSELDMQMGYAIGEEIEKVTGNLQYEKSLVFVGRVQHSSPNIYRLDAVGQSIFFREPSRYKVYYLRYLGFNVKQANGQQIEKAEKLAEDMPIWPLEGSVKEFEDVIVVRLK
ncbi:MAG: hypothetical protein E7270_00290 [Lachnospiraceae bacterium]|nr:hypothetical protein [Lachnospiraceae bacterium]